LVKIVVGKAFNSVDKQAIHEFFGVASSALEQLPLPSNFPVLYDKPGAGFLDS
jgi:hypothetical protein